MQRLFCGDSDPTPRAVAAWIKVARQEFFCGDLFPKRENLAGLRLEKALQSPVSLTRLVSHAPLSYRRTTSHIRSNRVGARVLQIVKQGSIRVRRTAGDCVINAGEMGILNSNTPFFVTAHLEKDAVYEAYQAVIPPDLFLPHLHGMQGLDDAFSLSSPSGQIVDRLLQVVIEQGDRLSARTANFVTRSLLEAVADMIRAESDCLHQPNAVNRRLHDIKNYIELNITDAELGHEATAASCGISPRYLSYILKAGNTTFSDLVWHTRVAKARDLLIAPRMRASPISQIAYLSGFKSAAHFSRRFKATYGCSPKDYRAKPPGPLSLQLPSA